MKIQNKLLTITLVPLILITYLTVQIILSKMADYQISMLIKDNITLMAVSSDFVTTLQKERGMSSMYVSGDQTILSQLTEMRSSNNEKAETFKKILKVAHIDQAKVPALLQTIDELSGLRRMVDAKESSGNIIPKFSFLIRQILDIQAAAVNAKTGFDLGKRMSSLVILSEAQESIGQLRAMVSGIITKDAPLSDEQISSITTVFGRFMANMNSPLLVALEDFQGVQKILTSDDSKTVIESYFKVLKLSATGGFNLSAPVFFGKITSVIGQMITLQVSESKSVLSSVTEISNDAYLSMILNIILTLTCVLALLVFAYFQSQSITRPLITTTTNLKESSSNLSLTSKDLSSASQSLAESSQNQAAALEEISASQEEINHILENSVSSSTRSNLLSEEIKKISVDSNESMSQLVKSMEDILKSNGRIQDFVKLVAQIGEKTQVIDDIVFQTKLLSFNASVEAERAGEHGRGFAVVAQEVGNLAQMSGRSAKEIADIVKNSIVGAENIAKENKYNVDKGNNFVAEVANKLNEVKEKAIELAKASKEILESTKEQALGINQITQGMNQLDQTNQQNATRAEETSESSKELAQQANNLEETVEVLTKMF